MYNNIIVKRNVAHPDEQAVALENGFAHDATVQYAAWFEPPTQVPLYKFISACVAWIQWAVLIIFCVRVVIEARVYVVVPRGKRIEGKLDNALPDAYTNVVVL